MLLLLSGAEVAVPLPTRAQLPLLLNMKVTLVTVSVGQVTETDSALQITVFKSQQILQVGQTSETDTARAITAVKDNNIYLSVTIAEYEEEALPMSHSGGVGITLTVDVVVEYDRALPIDWVKALLSPIRPPSLLLTPLSDAAPPLLVPLLEADEEELPTPVYPGADTYPSDSVFPGQP